LRVHRRSGNWRVPAALLAIFAVMFSISAFVIGPAISSESKPTTNQSTPATPATEGHEEHH
jgi:hypothetical protein